MQINRTRYTHINKKNYYRIKQKQNNFDVIFKREQNVR